MKKKEDKTDPVQKKFPRLYSTSMAIYLDPIPHVKVGELRSTLARAGVLDEFAKLYGERNGIIGGVLAKDVEEILGEIYHGKRGIERFF